MNPKVDKILLVILAVLVVFVNIGLTITLSKILLNYNKYISEQLLEIQIMILIVVFVNFLLLASYKE